MTPSTHSTGSQGVLYKDQQWGLIYSPQIYELIIKIDVVKIHVVVIWKIMSQSDHNYAHATTAELLWQVQNCDLIGSSESGL